jgi:hypothetical protein
MGEGLDAGKVLLKSLQCQTKKSQRRLVQERKSCYYEERERISSKFI